MPDRRYIPLGKAPLKAEDATISGSWTFSSGNLAVIPPSTSMSYGGYRVWAETDQYAYQYLTSQNPSGLALSAFLITSYATSGEPGILISRARGTEASPLPANAGDQIGGIGFDSYNSTDGYFTDVFRLAVRLGENPSGSGSPSGTLTFSSGDASTGNLIPRMQFAADGGITTYNATGTVATGGSQGAGTINCKGLYVDGVEVTASGSGFTDPANYATFYDDFWTIVSTSGVYSPWDAYVTGTGSIVNTVDHVSDHPGIAAVVVGTAATSRAGFLHTNNANSVNLWGGLLGCGATTIDFIFRVPTLPVSGTDAIEGRIGLIHGALSSAAAQSSVALKVHDNAGTFELRGACNTDGTETTTSTVVTLAGNTWYHGRIVINAAGTSVEFFVDGVSLGTITTNIPGTGRPLTLGAVAYRTTSSAATLLSIEIDVIAMKIALSSARWT